ncbi:hypothetical protein M758_9G125200 [Ceratodon purpureus]|uniref:Uncharacterized protein n=1 Tax=Ceratodon purpureus TaxID=3225 RepID=A0A8T0GTX6_CERPU|nr:hypothetical protein KC19_9G110800 [Ceratodon purpureus]KAG0606247.1 hypothetical protein M758_9G125200 [Ceratodon purpureus]
MHVMRGNLVLYLYRLSFVNCCCSFRDNVPSISASMSFWLYQDAGPVCRPHG